MSESYLEGSCLCGEVRWRFKGVPVSATACNCNACRRYGTLTAYGYEGEDIEVEGATTSYEREGGCLGFHFCARCGCNAYWRLLEVDAQGRRRIAVNLRLAEPERVAGIPVKHFDGLDSWEHLPNDGRCIRDLWF